IKDGLFKHLEFNENKIIDSLKGKSIVIIGASSGIGNDIAKICADLDAIVCPLSRRINNVDVKNRKSIDKALQKFRNETGRIHYVINTSGALIRKPLITMSDEEIIHSHEVNYPGVVNVARSAFPYLKESRGMLINFSSSSYTRGRANYSLYSSA